MRFALIHPTRNQRSRTVISSNISREEIGAIHGSRTRTLTLEESSATIKHQYRIEF